MYVYFCLKHGFISRNSGFTFQYDLSSTVCILLRKGTESLLNCLFDIHSISLIPARHVSTWAVKKLLDRSIQQCTLLYLRQSNCHRFLSPTILVSTPKQIVVEHHHRLINSMPSSIIGPIFASQVTPQLRRRGSTAYVEKENGTARMHSPESCDHWNKTKESYWNNRWSS